jgi:Bor protein
MRRSCVWRGRGVRALACCALAVLLAAGCYRYRVVASGEAGANPSTFPKTETLHSFLWGLIQDQSLTSVCEPDEALSSVRATTNLGFALITVVTLGIYAPARVEYQCANQAPDSGVIGARPPACPRCPRR